MAIPVGGFLGASYVAIQIAIRVWKDELNRR
jgi:hypothetical protein